MYGGYWAGQRTPPLSAPYSAKREFDTVSHDTARCASRIAPCALGRLNMGNTT